MYLSIDIYIDWHIYTDSIDIYIDLIDIYWFDWHIYWFDWHIFWLTYISIDIYWFDWHIYIYIYQLTYIYLDCYIYPSSIDIYTQYSYYLDHRINKSQRWTKISKRSACIIDIIFEDLDLNVNPNFRLDPKYVSNNSIIIVMKIFSFYSKTMRRHKKCASPEVLFVLSLAISISYRCQATPPYILCQGSHPGSPAEGRLSDRRTTDLRTVFS